MQTIYFDFETRPFARGLTIPPPICLAWGTETRDEVCAPDPYMFHDWLVDDTIELANAWIAFDMLVMGTAYPELLSLVHQKYLKGLVRDVALERKLIDIAQGRYERLTKQGWGLDACAARTKFPHKLDKTSWRTEFERLEGVPIAHYPQGARDYVLFDKRAAAWVDRANKIEGQGQYPGYHGIKVAQASLSLTRASAWGVLTDRRRTEQLEARVTHRLLELKAELVPHGLVREDGSRCLKAAAARILGAWRAAGLPAVLSKSGEAQLKAALKRGAAEAETRRRIEDNLEGLSLDKDAAILSGDELMVAYSEYASQDLLLGRTERAREGWYYPLQTRFDPLKETGRTSSTQPSAPIVGEQMQNFPRGKKDEALGLREVFKPRDGNRFLSADGSMAELHSLAHLCRTLSGYSQLGDMMDRGIDIHWFIASKFLGLEYEQIRQLANSGAPTGRADGHGKALDWDDFRTMAKAVNFGLPGGMGVDKLILSARKSYGVRISRADAQKLKQLWLDSFSEMRLYFRWISDQGDKFTHVHPITGFVRGDCHYCDGANQGFQHLTAYGAKDALFMVDLACFEPNSPLYGFRIWNFCHDEILLEGPAEKCQAAAHELRRICEREFNKYCPSSPTQWEPIICAVWTKKAKSKMKDGIYLEHMVAA